MLVNHLISSYKTIYRMRDIIFTHALLSAQYKQTEQLLLPAANVSEIRSSSFIVIV